MKHATPRSADRLVRRRGCQATVDDVNVLRQQAVRRALQRRNHHRVQINGRATGEPVGRRDCAMVTPITPESQVTTSRGFVSLRSVHYRQQKGPDSRAVSRKRPSAGFPPRHPLWRNTTYGKRQCHLLLGWHCRFTGILCSGITRRTPLHRAVVFSRPARGRPVEPRERALRALPRGTSCKSRTLLRAAAGSCIRPGEAGPTHP